MTNIPIPLTSPMVSVKQEIHAISVSPPPFLYLHLLVHGCDERVLQEDGEVVLIEVKNRKHASGSKDAERLAEHRSRHPFGGLVVHETDGGEVELVRRLAGLLRRCMSERDLNDGQIRDSAEVWK